MSESLPEVIAEEIDKEFRRKDDSFLRNIVIGVITALVVQLLGFIYFAGMLSNQVDNHTKAIEAILVDVASKDSTVIALERVKTVVEGLAYSTGKLSDKLDLVASEQLRRNLIIDQLQSQLRLSNAINR